MDGMDLMATAMHAMQARLDVAAGNLANATSDGFRRSVEHVALTREGLERTVSVDAAPGPLRRTGRNLDVTVAGTSGGMLVRDAAGRVQLVRSATLARGTDGTLRDPLGRTLEGQAGPVRASADASIDERGAVHDGGRIVARLRLEPGTTLESGAVMGSNVDAVHEMVDMLGAQRSFETAQKTLSALDDVRARATSDVARVKA